MILFLYEVLSNKPSEVEFLPLNILLITWKTDIHSEDCTMHDKYKAENFLGSCGNQRESSMA